MVGKTCQGGPSYHAFYWSDATGYIDLDTFGIDLVHDINNDGVVSGGTFDGAVRWTLEKGIESIGTLAAPHDDSGYGRAINQFGEVAGISVHALTGPDGYRAFFYSDATGMLSIAPTIFLRSIGQGINDQGDVVGTEGNDSAQHNNPWVWMRATGERFFLNDIVSSADFAAFDYAIDINNRGQILLRGSTSAPGPDHPVILTPIITGDLDGDGAVGFSDLLILLAAWGECPAPPADCPADLDASGDVGFGDLLILLTNWTG